VHAFFLYRRAVLLFLSSYSGCNWAFFFPSAFLRRPAQDRTQRLERPFSGGVPPLPVIYAAPDGAAIPFCFSAYFSEFPFRAAAQSLFSGSSVIFLPLMSDIEAFAFWPIGADFLSLPGFVVFRVSSSRRKRNCFSDAGPSKDFFFLAAPPVFFFFPFRLFKMAGPL